MPTDTFWRLNDDKRNKITRCAMDAFAANGFTGTSVDSVAEAAGVAKGALYRYFDNKKDMYLHVVDHLREDTEQYIEEFLEKHRGQDVFVIMRELADCKLRDPGAAGHPSQGPLQRALPGSGRFQGRGAGQVRQAFNPLCQACPAAGNRQRHHPRGHRPGCRRVYRSVCRGPFPRRYHHAVPGHGAIPFTTSPRRSLNIKPTR